MYKYGQTGELSFSTFCELLKGKKFGLKSSLEGFVDFTLARLPFDVPR